MKSKILNKETLKLLILIVAATGYLFWEVVEEYTFIEFFYEKCIAISWMLVGVYFINEKDTLMSRVFVIAVFNNLLDEFFFNPFEFGINEKILGIILIIAAYHAHKITIQCRNKV